MTPKYILLTGGAGYVGSHVNKVLTKAGYQTLVLDNLVTGHREFAQWGEFILGDIMDREQLRLVFDRYPIAAVMHFAACAYVGESVSNPGKYYVNNVAGTLNLLEAMRAAGVWDLIFSSSCATYGLPAILPIPETHPTVPISPYGRSKLMVEQMMADYAAAYGMRYVALRYFNAAGADPDNEIGERHEPEPHLIPLCIASALGEKSLHIFGNDYSTPDGTCIRDYIHVLDIAQAHRLALEYLESGGASDVFNLGNGEGFSIKQVIKACEKISGKKISVAVAPRRVGDPPVLIGASQKADKILGWSAQIPGIDEIMMTAWRWHTTHRHFCGSDDVVGK